jgi:hypothetical protein
MTLSVRLAAGKASAEREFELGQGWNRIRLAVDAPANVATVRLRWPAAATLGLWGINLGRVNLPTTVNDTHPHLDDLQAPQISPETFYLPHDVALALDIDPEGSARIVLAPGPNIALKKCSYCQRLLPLDPDRLGSLSFHKHNAKATNHQNECRSCKKWRINNNFNPKRTVDQLNESSLITRERKVFLREPQILQDIKDRTGAGLKSQVWERFGRKCFFCGRDLKLDEVQLDHTRPLAYLWPIDEHATCLCAEHNNLKKEKFPVDFYTSEQLERLSKLCGLALEDLRKKTLNEKELERIIQDLPRFAREWDPRTFAATARKIAEMRPDIDLLIVLRKQSRGAYREMTTRLRERPPSVTDV